MAALESTLAVLDQADVIKSSATILTRARDEGCHEGDAILIESEGGVATSLSHP
ncbi:hypothetical protein TIFTF001_010074 [Ficus carica]|uniref:Uncharacterized protein n=1 Tax=Ficus carica TaxID=3494 RepID=A0AA88D1S5_FICCA|nr:hypothetical protein TIFTF001_010074 [Ficus carica]